MSLPESQDILDFWFRDIPESAWWKKDPAFDAMLQQRFAVLHKAATQGELYSWRHSIQGRLAEIIVLDQFSRNLYRDSAMAFSCDGMALILAQEAIASGRALTLPPRERAFLYMPFMHSESATLHKIAVALFSEDGMSGNLDFEQRHKHIIDRFGRYPHRNSVLGRTSTPEEIIFLNEPGSSF